MAVDPHVFDTGAKLSYLNPELCQAYPGDGQEEDFYPGVGNFTTQTHLVPVTLDTETITIRTGILPQILQTTLMMAGTEGILGTEKLDSYRIIYAPRRKLTSFNARKNT